MTGRSREITWYCGKSWAPWSPASLKVGIGGSQTAVIQLSREWTRRGFRVRVFCFLEGPAAEYEGVHYLPYEKFARDLEHDILIIWRLTSLGILEDLPVNANAVFVDLHDHTGADQLDTVDFSRVKSFFLKSEFHSQLFPEISKDKVTIIPNGVDRSYLEIPWNSKSPFRMVYSSNYYRGLEQMLEFGWPLIRKEVPEAELHLYYGWELFDALRPDQQGQDWKKEFQARIVDLEVFDHGKVGQEELMREKAKSTIHYYGCIWPETDCISVRESALVECIPVTTDFAALRSKPYGIKVSGDGDPRSRKTQEALARRVIEVLSNPKKAEQAKHGLRDLAAEETWDRIADKWIEVIS